MDVETLRFPQRMHVPVQFLIVSIPKLKRYKNLCESGFVFLDFVSIVDTMHRAHIAGNNAALHFEKDNKLIG
jgi:hypothetical protein